MLLTSRWQSRLFPRVVSSRLPAMTPLVNVCCGPMLPQFNVSIDFSYVPASLRQL